METIRFRNDTATRRRLFVPDSFAHPAKGQTGMWQTMIERYSKPGDTVLDPLAGIGTTLLGALMGRNCVLVELENHFVLPMRRSWEKMRQMPMLGYEMGSVVILRGDARCLPLLSADCVITSPPFQDTAQSTDSAFLDKLEVRRNGSRFQGGNRDAYAPGNTENVGNQRGDAYWQSMARIYSECWRVLRPGGIMALVLKGFTRDGKYVDLPGQTEAMLLEAGWLKHDHWRRELWSLSFWRILQKRRDPAAFDPRLNFEEVLAFRKPEGVGQGVSAIITSPPYEASEVAQSSDGEANRRFRAGEYEGDALKGMGLSKGYTRPVSLIVTSPPYEGLSFTGDSKASQSENEAKWGRKFGPAYSHQSYTKEVK